MLGIRAFLKTRRAPILLGVAFMMAFIWPLSVYTSLAFSGRGIVSIPLAHFIGTFTGVLFGMIPYAVARDVEHLREHTVRAPQLYLALFLVVFGGLLVFVSSTFYVALGGYEPFFSPISQLRSFLFLLSLGCISSALFGKETSWVIGTLYVAYTLYFGYTWQEQPTMWNVWDAPAGSQVAWGMAVVSLLFGFLFLYLRPSRPVFIVR